jgi:HK97 gp10 family phage protein
MSEVRFVDNSDIILRRVASNCQTAMEQVADLLVEAVQEKILYGYSDVHGDPPHTEIVDTGALFDSISASVKRASQNAFTTSVGADTPYAGYVHDGTYKLKGRPFVTDAVMDSQEAITNTLAGTIPQGIND